MFARLSSIGALGTSALIVSASVAVAGPCGLLITHLKNGPGIAATDKRTPELGNDLGVLAQSKVSMADGIKEAEKTGPVIEAKFELDDTQHLSLSLYPAGEKLDKDAERNKFEELAGDPTVSPFKGGLEVFADQEHLTRSARDLTLVQLSRVSLLDAVKAMSNEGFVYWAIPTIRKGRAGYGVYTLDANKKSHYAFVDGDGPAPSFCHHPADLGTGPGAKATDARTPELGSNLAIMRTSKITMSKALAQLEAKQGPAIEAKFELGDDGKLSLSVYPVGKGIKTDAERNTFFETAGDPTATAFAPTTVEFKVPDVEHLTRSARDLTIVQTASLTLREAVTVAESQIQGGIVYWAIPTIRDGAPGYGVYVLDAQDTPHYFFVR